MNFIESSKRLITHISHVQHIFFYIIRMPISYSTASQFDISSIHHYFIFLGLQRSIGQPKV